MQSLDVLLVDPPSYQVMAPDFDTTESLLSTFAGSFNPGLMSIASWLELQGIHTGVYHVTSINELGKLYSAITQATCIVGISVTSGTQYLEALFIAESIKKLVPSMYIILGGWHIRAIGCIAFCDSDHVDFLCVCEGEEALRELVVNIQRGRQWEKVDGILARGDNDKSSDYSRIFDINQLDAIGFNLCLNPSDGYRPYIEESRGCNRSCEYCVYSELPPAYRIREAANFEAMLASAVSVFGSNREYALLSANFGINAENTLTQIGLLKNASIKWQAETHIDNPWEEYIELLPNAGLSQMTIGLESASEATLRRMRKTANPKRYLSRAEALLRRLAGSGVKVTLNIMSYIHDDLQDTLCFIERNSEFIHNLNASALILIPRTSLARNASALSKRHLLKSDYAKRVHLQPVNIGDSLSYNEVVDLFASLTQQVRVRQVSREVGPLVPGQ
jgi:radical SAM superfamily enzyme YgiQ (UPF0313 family)